MSEHAWSDEFDSRTRKWCDKIASVVADALVMGKVVEPNQFDLTEKITAEELYARLCVRDYPPPVEPK